MLVGVQFNQNLFAEELVSASGKTIPGTRVPERSLSDLEQRLTVLKPQFVRMFFSPHQDAGSPSTPGTRESFIKTAELAQAVGATINITVQSVATYVASEESREKGMNEFAAVLDELVNSHRITNVRWVTLENEPNTPGSAHINPPVLNQMYRYLDAELVNRGLRSQIRFMAGDLIQGDNPNPEHPSTAVPLPASFDSIDSDWSGYTNQGYWVTWMEHNMADIVDAYSIHIYWNAYSDISATPKFEQRLATIAGVGKPFYVTEFGVRGNRPVGSHAPGILRDGTPVEKSNQAAFQHAWFQIAAARLNCAGTAKWDGYYAVYDRTPQSYYAIGAPVDDSWDCYPMYDLLWMLANTIDPSWHPRSVLGLQPAWAAVAEFRGRPTGLTIVGLDTRGATTNEASEEQSTFTLPTGLPTGTLLDLLVWNDKGDGRVAPHAPVPVGEQGEVTISIRRQCVFALTTNSLPPPPGA
jgi:hypothetical protein